MIKKKIDKLGRVVIPTEFRQGININNNEDVNIELQGKKIIITNPKNNKSDAEEVIRESIEIIKDNIDNNKLNTKDTLEKLLKTLAKYKG